MQFAPNSLDLRAAILIGAESVPADARNQQVSLRVRNFAPPTEIVTEFGQFHSSSWPPIETSDEKAQNWPPSNMTSKTFAFAFAFASASFSFLLCFLLLADGALERREVAARLATECKLASQVAQLATGNGNSQLATRSRRHSTAGLSTTTNVKILRYKVATLC